MCPCLIVAPGSLVEQWQDELWEKFGLDFELMSRRVLSRRRAPATRSWRRTSSSPGSISCSRSEDLLAKLEVTDWDLVIVDEAHKMSAHQYGNEVQQDQALRAGRGRSATARATCCC